MRITVLCLCIGWIGLLCTLRSARAGAWLFTKDRGQIIFSSGFASARNAYGASGRLVATQPYRKLEARIYIEHGVTDWLTFVGEGNAMRFSAAPAPYDVIALLIAEAKAGAPLYAPPPRGLSYEGLGLGAAGARLRLWETGDYVFSFEGSLRGASPQARRFLDMPDPLQFDARLLMGRSFSLFGMAGFLDTELGFRGRGQNGDEARFDATAGIRPLDGLLLLAQSYSAVPFRKGAASALAQQKFQLSAVYDALPWLSLQIGGVAAPVGPNAPAERGVIAAIWCRY